MIYGSIFFDEIEKTHLFYSPVAKEFIFTEKVVGPVPEAVRAKAEDHHSAIAYRLASGSYVSRIEFEKSLPFIFYKNMEVWGLLPLKIDGQTFDKAAIKARRQVLELKSGYIRGNSPETPVWPLLESNPGQARLVFPDDRFRMTASGMEFINADTNQVDPALSQSFSRALEDKSFTFPARSVNGKFTVLKPFDEEVFLVDFQYRVFHLKRVNGWPRVIQPPIDPQVKIRHIQVSENKKREYYGLALSESGKAYLLTYKNYALLPLPLEGFDPDRMDLKLIFNPLYITAVFSDEQAVHAVAMDKNLKVIDRFSHTMSRSNTTPAQTAFALLFPFQFHLESQGQGFLALEFSWSGLPGSMGILVCLVVYVARIRLRREKPSLIPVVLILVTGIYGLAAMEATGIVE